MFTRAAFFSNSNRTRTARHLGISVRALQKKIGKYGLRQGGE